MWRNFQNAVHFIFHWKLKKDAWFLSANFKNSFEYFLQVSKKKTVSTVSKQFFSFVTEKQFQFVTETEKQFQLSFNLLLKLKNRFEFSFKLLLKLKNSFKTVSTVMKLFFRNCYDPPCSWWLILPWLINVFYVVGWIPTQTFEMTLVYFHGWIILTPLDHRSWTFCPFEWHFGHFGFLVWTKNIQPSSFKIRPKIAIQFKIIIGMV